MYRETSLTHEGERFVGEDLWLPGDLVGRLQCGRSVHPHLSGDGGEQLDNSPFIPKLLTHTFSHILDYSCLQVAKGLNPVRVGFFLLYIVLKLLQAFTYAWYGSLIAEEVTARIFLPLYEW